LYNLHRGITVDLSAVNGA